MGVSFPAGTVVRTGAERATLVRRTYSLVFVSVLVTIVGVMFALSQPPVFDYVAQHRWLPIIATFALLFLVLGVQRSFPINILAVFLFTFSEGIVLSPIIYAYGQRQPGLITQAATLTIGAFFILTAYAFVSRRDFSAWRSFFFTGVFVVIGGMLLNAFVFHSSSIDLALASITILVFCGLLVYDTWRLRNQYGPDDYVAATVQIYLDLLNLFMAILRVLGGRRN